MRTWLLMVLTGLSMMTACGDSDDPPTTPDADMVADAAPDATPDATPPPGPPSNPDFADLEEGWNEIAPGGDTICSRGSEFSYFVHPGTVNKVIVDFIGGGACWNAGTCSIADAIFSDSVDGVRAAVDLGVGFGIYDRTREENPFKDWTHIIIPYCTGDIHWGDATTTYGEGASEVTINHRGAVNTRTVLDWMYRNVEAPEQVFVTGCSAGSYGSLAWSAYIMQQYPSASVIQFGDSGAGVITETFFRDSFPSWNATPILPDWIEGLDPETVDIFSLELADLYRLIGGHSPDNIVSQYNTTYDNNQTFYYEAMGGEGGAMGWSMRMLASTQRIIESTPNYRNFQAPGEQHCIIVQPNFYEVESNGVRLVDWLQNLVDGETVENVTCVDCERDTPGT